MRPLNTQRKNGHAIGYNDSILLILAKTLGNGNSLLEVILDVNQQMSMTVPALQRVP